MTNLFQAKIDATTSNLKTYNEIVNHYFSTGISDAKNYSVLLGDYLTDPSSCASFYQSLKDYQLASNYEEIGIFSIDGMGVSSRNSNLDLRNDPMFNNIIQSSENVYFYKSNHLDSIFFTYPILKNDKIIGYVYLRSQNNLEPFSTDTALFRSISTFVVLDEQNNLVAYVGNRSKAFDYTTIEEEGMLYTPEKPLHLMDVLHLIESNSALYLSKYLNTSDDFREKPENTSLGIWYKNPLSGPMDQYSTLVFKRESLDTSTLETIGIIFLISLFTLFIPLFIMILLASSQIKANTKLRNALYFDPVTGGQNYQYFKYSALKLLKKRKYQSKNFYIVCFDIRKFRVFNEVHGTNQGDELLENMYLTLKKTLQKNELFARFSADHFTMLLYLFDNESIQERVTKILTTLSSLYPNERLSFIAGIYPITDRKISIDKMNNNAFVAKDTLRDNQNLTLALFDESMRIDLLRTKELEDRMEHALESKEFVVYLQPKYHSKRKQFSGAEALVRWKISDTEMISPGEFIPIFEKNGFIIKLDDYMISGVCEIQRDFLKKGKELLPISVNISRAHFFDPALAEHICQLVDQYQIPHQYIELELTESAFFDDKQMILNTVNKLQSYGFLVSMDDFGSGFSSLNSLKDLPLDIIKLDGEFFRGTENGDRSKTVIMDTIRMAKNLKMDIVAEGIETKDQVDFLSEIGCDYIQGYYYARPMPVDAFESFIESNQLKSE